MIKVQNNIATREPLPSFLVGLAPESLADLSWTDPALGVSDAAWWPEVDQSPALGQYERYGDETLTIDAANQRVIVTRAVVPWSAEEIEADRKGHLPQEVSTLSARLTLLKAGLLTEVDAALDSLPEPQRTEAKIIWDHASTVRRDHPLIALMVSQGIVTADQVDDLFLQAASAT